VLLGCFPFGTRSHGQVGDYRRRSGCDCRDRNGNCGPEHVVRVSLGGLRGRQLRFKLATRHLRLCGQMVQRILALAHLLRQFVERHIVTVFNS
jgi:hypothetical protein